MFSNGFCDTCFDGQACPEERRAYRVEDNENLFITWKVNKEILCRME